MRKELITLSDKSRLYSFVYYNSYAKKRIRLSREYIRQRFGKDITDPDEADDIIKILEKELKTLSREKEKRFELAEGDYQFGKLIELYTEHQKSSAPNSYRSNIFYFRYYVLHYFLEVKQCHDLDEWRRHYEDFREWLEKSAMLLREPTRHIAYASKNICIKSLNVFMRLMHRKQYLENLAICTSFPAYRIKQRSIDDVYTPEEMEAVYQQLIKMNHPVEAKFFRFLFFSGMRYNEACGVSLADIFEGKIDDESFHKKLVHHKLKYYGYVVIDSQPARRRDSKNADGSVPRKPLKGKRKIDEKSARIVPMVDQRAWSDLAELYNEQLAHYKRKLWGENLKDYLLFEQVTSAANVYLGSACQLLQIPYKSWHCLRHSRATYLIGETGDQILARLWLGHKSIAVFERYNHIYQSIIRKAKKVRPKELKPIRT